ncbi:polysaccharide pyruvyl transferase family protein [Streptomyces sp. RFCAC02]|uniref:polysaccharide pyruvyl transferase family protein n=1 Tax=Streptomyces sp. RFCAC02 TaxID=2499143 RepID=UPI00101F22B0|nr:polysaccharide pyruvyl transferase family protein [Streptomyces sp. RFCAC02]
MEYHKRRVAFAAAVDAERPAGLAALLRSLALTNPAVCEDVLLRHDGDAPPAGTLDAVRALHPRLVPLPSSSPLPPPGGAYDTVIVLPPGTVVREDIGHLLTVRQRVVHYEPVDGEAPGEPPTDDEFRAEYCALPGRKAPDLLFHCALPLLRAGGPITTRAGKRVDPAGLARVVGSALHQQGRYEEAVEVLRPAAGDPRRARNHEALGSALMALSRYEEAETHLLVATAHPVVAPRAFAQLARLAWLHGRDDDARRYALTGLDADPTDAGCRALHARTAPPPAAGPAAPVVPGDQIAHVALYAEGQENSGDKVLPEAVRRCFGPDTGEARWHSVQVHRLVDDRVLAELNSRRGVIVGGGGLFLPDTWPNGNSGWQWNVTDDALRRITVPLAVFAVGFNLFDGQHLPPGRLAGSVRALVERAAFVGLRNRGSVERVRALLPAELGDRVRHQPCPTTVLRHLVPGWRDATPADRADTVLLNCAYDRAGLRFGHDYGHFLDQMARTVRALRAHAEIRYAAHTPADETFVHDLRRAHGLTLPVTRLYDMTNEGLLDAYRRTRLVIGMRGHATMIPFGCGTPALSLISHPKLAYFLDDIGRPEWGVSVHTPSLAADLSERATELLTHHEDAVRDVHACQEPLLTTTRANAAELEALF